MHVLQGETAKAGRLGFVAGLIPQEKLNGFERLLFRCVLLGAVSVVGVQFGGQSCEIELILFHLLEYLD